MKARDVARLVWVALGVAAMALLLYRSVRLGYGYNEVVVWISAFCTLSIFSFLYKENAIYRFGEHLMLGTSIGYGIGATFMDVLKVLWWVPLLDGLKAHDAGAIFFCFSSVFVGLLWYGLFFKQTVWLMRVVMGIVMGAGAGLSIKQNFVLIIPQITDSFKSPIVLNEMGTRNAGAIDVGNSVNNVIYLVALLLTINFFFFSFDHTRKVSSRIQAFLDKLPRWLGTTLSVIFMVFSGRFWLMLAFGVFFGNTVMTRLSVFIERIWFLLQQWVQPVLSGAPK